MKSKTKTEQRQYPREVWVLTHAYAIKQVTVVKRSIEWSSTDYGDETADGKRYAVKDMHPTKAVAIAHGRQQIEERRAYLEKQSTLLDARSKKLDKAQAD